MSIKTNTYNAKTSTIYHGDNILFLNRINSNCIDLIYLDPPFNKKKIFTAPIGSSAEGASFADIFKKEDIKNEWIKTIQGTHDELFNYLNSIKAFKKNNNYNYCYLVYIAIRLLECRRILKPTGSLFLHCDPTMNGYLRIVLDCIFHEDNFRNEIVWYYHSGGGRSKTYFNKKHDTIFWYSKESTGWVYNLEDIRIPYMDTSRYAKSGITHNSTGKTYLPNEKGKNPDDVWVFPIINPLSKERTGYPTQKPLKLLKRIIQASCPPDGIILDPFCGCATTCVAAEELNRKWLGIDISVKAYELVKKRISNEINKPLIAKILEKINFETKHPPRTDSINEDDFNYSNVYIISNPKFKNEYKVGIAKNLTTRLSSYQTGDPARAFKIEYHKRTPYYKEIESFIHEKYENRHEWVVGALENIKNDIENYKAL